MSFAKYFQVFLTSRFSISFITSHDTYDEGSGPKEDGVFEEFLFEVGIASKEDGEHPMVSQNVLYLLI